MVSAKERNLIDLICSTLIIQEPIQVIILQAIRVTRHNRDMLKLVLRWKVDSRWIKLYAMINLVKDR